MSLVGRSVGSIRLERLLGRGGMGEVYRGFDEKLQRVVAVKTIRDEQRLSGDARSRFLREARILSRLAHPAICQVHDLIETADADYLIFEFVEGETLESLLLARRLSEREALELAVKIAAALEVAHREHIVHRDLKPANVMVTPDGVVKVLDFGLARSTGDEMLPAAAASRAIPTAAHRPPEAIAPAGGDPELTLHLPGVDSEPSDDPDRAPGPPATPDPDQTIRFQSRTSSASDLSAALTQQGWIVGTVHYMSPEQAGGADLTVASDMFSLGIVLQEMLTGTSAYPKEPLAQQIVRVAKNGSLPISCSDPDIARFVEDLKHPTPSRRPSAAEAVERLRFLLEKPQRMRRRRLLLTGVAAAFAILVAVLAVVSVLAVREKRARFRAETLAVERDHQARRANREARTANRVVGFLVELFEEADPETARGRDISVRDVVAKGSERIGTGLAAEPLVRARLQETLGGITWRLGNFDDAVRLLEESRAIVERDPDESANALVTVNSQLGAVYLDLGRFAEARASLERADAMAARASEVHDEDRARLLNYWGALADAEGDLAAAETHYEQSLALLRAGESPPREVALVLNNLGVLAWRRGDFALADERMRASLDLNQALLGTDHPHVAAQLNNLGILARERGAYGEAEQLHLRALAIARKTLGAEHVDVAAILSSLGRLYVRQERLDAARDRFERARRIWRAAYGPDHAEVATAQLRLGDLARRRGDLGAAERDIAAALATLRSGLGDDHPRLFEAWSALARLRLAQDRRTAAVDALAQAVRIGTTTLGADHPDIDALRAEFADPAPVGHNGASGGPA